VIDPTALGPHELASAKQQRIDLAAVCRHVELDDGVGTGVGEAFGLLDRDAELLVERASGVKCQRLGQIPEQLMELPHDREHLEHLLRGVRGTAPVLSAIRDLGHLLPCAEAVVDGAPPKASLPELAMDAAAEVRLQVGTGLLGLFVDREVRRG
jgi:hypothetical protein